MKDLCMSPPAVSGFVAWMCRYPDSLSISHTFFSKKGKRRRTSSRVKPTRKGRYGPMMRDSSVLKFRFVIIMFTWSPFTHLEDIEKSKLVFGQDLQSRKWWTHQCQSLDRNVSLDIFFPTIYSLYALGSWNVGSCGFTCHFQTQCNSQCSH